MKKNVVKINENTIKQIVAESVKKVLNEIGDTPAGQKALRALYDRNRYRWEDDLKDGKFKQDNGRTEFSNAQDAYKKALVPKTHAQTRQDDAYINDGPEKARELAKAFDDTDDYSPIKGTFLKRQQFLKNQK